MDETLPILQPWEGNEQVQLPGQAAGSQQLCPCGGHK